MADVLGGQLPLEQWFLEMPVCTRWWMTGVVGASVLVQCRIVTPFQLFYSVRTVFYKSQYWRLATTFIYFGPLSVDLVYHVFFLQRYSRLLEEGLGRSPAQYAWLLACASAILLCLAPLLSIAFLAQPLSNTLIYVWSRKNPDALLSFLGLFAFRAPFLPWTLLLFAFIVHGSLPKNELCGIVVGHIWYFFTDVYPRLHNGHSPLDPPAWWVRLWDGPPELPPEQDASPEPTGSAQASAQPTQ